VVRIFAALGLCLSCVPRMMAQETESVELTKSDLFGLPNWQTRTVGVDGFVLGMTRERAVEVANAKNLRLVPSGPGLTIAERRGSCVQARCSVHWAHGNWLGIDLFFDGNKINKIAVGLSADMDPEVKEVNIAREFKGLTYQFFNNYSERLRNQILGSAEAKRDSSMPRDTDHLKYLQYEYPQSGVVLHLTTNDQEPIDLTLDFSAPR